MRFEKWQALGNDYLIIERDELPFELTASRVRKLCEGHFGVYADGILLLSPHTDERFVAGLRIFNPDGSEAELSGNGAREAIMYLRSRGWTDRDTFAIETAAGEIRPTITGPTTCRVDMGHAALTSKDYPGGPSDGKGELKAAVEGIESQSSTPARERTWSFQHVSIGNPQCAIAVEQESELSTLDLPAVGPAIEAHPSFPNRTNVSWYAVLDPHRIRARIFERGVGETLSSGTGATGAAVAHVLRGGASPVSVILDGGELEVEVGEDLHVNLTGWAVPVFEGRLSEAFLKELNETE